MFEQIHYKRRINNFFTTIDIFCTKQNIKEKTFENFINYEYNNTSHVGATYGYLYDAPKMLLICSKSFWSYYEKLDSDFQNDILSGNDIYIAKNIILKYKGLKKFIQKKLQNDFIFDF